MNNGEDPEEAIIRAVIDTKDNDTISAIVGAAMEALYGEDVTQAVDLWSDRTHQGQRRRSNVRVAK